MKINNQSVLRNSTVNFAMQNNKEYKNSNSSRININSINSDSPLNAYANSFWIALKPLIGKIFLMLSKL